ncbi:hypothetical protein [Sphaerisporangium flaviroseum]
MATTHAHEHHDHGDTFAVHGMLLVVGDDRFYFSHLPMFSVVAHRFQVLLEIEFDDEVREALRADAKTTGGDLYTFAPRPFPLVELDPADGGPARTSLVGTIFHGHFERGGHPIARDATARIRRVAHYRPLDPEARHDDRAPLRYLCFGKAGDLFLAHEITARPDFDQVLKARMVPGSVQHAPDPQVPADVLAADFDLAVPVTVSRTDTPRHRLTAGETVDGTFLLGVSRTGAHEFNAQLKIDREIYMESGELT